MLVLPCHWPPPPHWYPPPPPSCLLLPLPLDHCLSRCRHLANLVDKEVFRPVCNIAEHIQFKRRQAGRAVSDIAEIQRGVFLRQFLLCNSALQSPQQIFTVAF